jgi:hypothetical protein
MGDIKDPIARALVEGHAVGFLEGLRRAAEIARKYHDFVTPREIATVIEAEIAKERGKP